MTMQTTNNRILVRGLIIVVCAVCVLLALVNVTSAQGMQYKPLVGIPGLENTTNPSLPEFVNKVYIMLITLGAMLGVLRIAWAGVKYSLSDVVTDKSSAIGTIKGVLLGLAILLLPYLVLNEINPGLTNLNVINLKPTPFNSNTSGGSPSQQTTPTPGTKVKSCSVGISDTQKCERECAEELNSSLVRVGDTNVFNCTYTERARPEPEPTPVILSPEGN